MADETSTTEAPEVETTEPTEAPKPQGDVPPEVKRALAKANKEAETLRLKLQEFEDRDKSEAQKLAERAEAAERAVAAAEARALRLEVASEKGLTAAQAKRLVGSSREELEADADELLETFKPVEAKPVVPDLDLGTRAPGNTKDESPRGLIAAGLEQSTKKKSS